MTRREWIAGVGAAAGFGPTLRSRAASGAIDDPTRLSVAELAAAYEVGTLTPLEVVGAYLSRIERENPNLGAFITVARDRALDETRRLLLAGAGVGTDARRPLLGIPVAHKDLFQTRGVRTTGGSRLYEHDVPTADADLVARCASHGAVLVGKTNTHELGGGVTTINPFFGTTRNPRDPTRIAGGSSGGSAAAVVARLTLVATGSDTGGSIRIPAALCGCVGLKPTFGWLPTAGLLGACPTFDHAGLLTRTVEDAALAFAAVAPPLPAPARPRSATPVVTVSAPMDTFRTRVAAGLRGLRVGVARRFFFDALEPGVADAVGRTLDRLGAAGAQLRDVDLGVTADTYGRMFDPIAVNEIRVTYGRVWRARPDAFSKDFAAVFEGPPLRDAAYAAALAAREAFQRTVAHVLDDVDVVVTPTVPVVAPAIAGPIDGARILRNTWAFNAARLPAVTVPCGEGASGLPVGLQLAGRAFDDATLLGIARLVELLVTTAAA